MNQPNIKIKNDGKQKHNSFEARLDVEIGNLDSFGTLHLYADGSNELEARENLLSLLKILIKEVHPLLPKDCADSEGKTLIASE